MNITTGILVIFCLFNSALADISTLGSVLSAGSGFLPPELRGIAGTAANMALAQANLKKGMVEVIMDGSDYPWICLCATRTQLARINAGRADKIAPDQCPDYPYRDNKVDPANKVGCRPPQVNIDDTPLPTAPSTTPSKR
jgi:hypothetical protein